MHKKQKKFYERNTSRNLIGKASFKKFESNTMDVKDSKLTASEVEIVEIWLFQYGLYKER